MNPRFSPCRLPNAPRKKRLAPAVALDFGSFANMPGGSGGSLIPRNVSARGPRFHTARTKSPIHLCRDEMISPLLTCRWYLYVRLSSWSHGTDMRTICRSLVWWTCAGPTHVLAPLTYTSQARKRTPRDVRICRPVSQHGDHGPGNNVHSIPFTCCFYSAPANSFPSFPPPHQ